MLTILNDPAGITGSVSHPLDYTVSLQENIERHLSGGAGCELRINGITVDPLAGTYEKLLADGVAAGTTKQADINGIFNLTALNEVTGGKTPAAGLGKE